MLIGHSIVFYPIIFILCKGILIIYQMDARGLVLRSWIHSAEVRVRRCENGNTTTTTLNQNDSSPFGMPMRFCTEVAYFIVRLCDFGTKYITRYDA